MVESARNGTLHVGVTSDPVSRVSQHRQELTPGFTSRYSVKTLVWFDVYDDINEAIRREKQIKRLAQGLEAPAHRDR